MSSSSEAEARRASRAQAEVRIFRQDEGEAEADADALYWDRIPVDERAEFVWRLSLELHELSCPTPVIGLDALLRNKRAFARPQDLADVDALERLTRAKRR